MKEISIEQFKSEFQTIADLVISLDEKNRAFLKPRDEIKIYIESKSLDIQENIIDELLEVYSLGGISDSYLNNKEVNYWKKVPFEAYCNIIKKSIEAKIKYSQFIDDDRVIQEEKEKIKSLPQLSTNLTISKRCKLFELLKKEKFIPDKTDPDCFNWALSVTDEKPLKQPSPWQSIKWNKSKMAFVELFKPYIDTITSRPANRVVEELFLDEFGEPMKDLKSPGKDQVSGSWGNICIIIDKLKI